MDHPRYVCVLYPMGPKMTDFDEFWSQNRDLQPLLDVIGEQRRRARAPGPDFDEKITDFDEFYRFYDKTAQNKRVSGRN